MPISMLLAVHESKLDPQVMEHQHPLALVSQWTTLAVVLVVVAVYPVLVLEPKVSVQDLDSVRL